MEINYIILAHKNPLQVQRLIDRLDTPNCYFYIHIDKGTDKIPFVDVLATKSNVFFVSDLQREYGTWGDIGIVKATISILTQIIKDNRNGYCILMSGQDYPLQNNEAIHDFLKTNYGNHFIATFPLPHSGWGNEGGLDRLTHYKINFSTTRMDFIQLPSLFERTFYRKQTIPKLLTLLKKKRFSALLKPLVKRKFPNYLKPYAGGQWWALPIETVQDILKFIDSNPKYTEYHKETLLPDEIYFHSILIHLKGKDESFRIRPSITYVNWIRKNTPLPVTFTEGDIKELKAEVFNDKLFARKFDIDVDEKILDIIDNDLLI